MKSYFAITGIILLCLVSLAAADVTIVTETEMDMIGAGKIDVEQVQYVKGDRSYDENTTLKVWTRAVYFQIINKKSPVGLSVPGPGYEA